MLENESSLALIPKAKAIAARSLSRADYQELMRKRSVLEVVDTLKAHPYFTDSLGGLSQTNLHRSQIEEVLHKDIFYKYERLMHFNFAHNALAGSFVVRCEVDELLNALRLLSLGKMDQYIVQLPGFLTQKLCFNMLELAKSRTFDELLKVLKGTPYVKLLMPLRPTAMDGIDYLACEQALRAYYFVTVLHYVDALPRRVQKQAQLLFRQEAEIYNLDLLYRVKAFYADKFTPQRLRSLLLPVYGHLSQRKLYQLADARDLPAFMTLYNNSRAKEVYGARSAKLDEALDVQEQRVLYRTATRVLHFSSHPQITLAAFVFMARVQSSNIINIIEGVRYGLAPDAIEQFLKF